MTKILFLIRLILFNISHTSIIGQTPGSALADGSEVRALNFNANEYQLNFKLAASDVKSASLLSLTA